MSASMIQTQRDTLIQTIRNITKGDWKVLVLDENSKKIVDNVVKEDDILNQNIANIERIEEKRDANPDMDAIYILSPQEHLVECLQADFERRRYRRAYLVWTAMVDTAFRRRIDSNPDFRRWIAEFRTLTIDYYPRESHLITFRDPWSFPVLYHPACNALVGDHLRTLAQKIAGICISLGEYPKVRYYKPRNPTHEASVLCGHLARFAQDELDKYAQWNKEFPAHSNRAQGILIITDRSMDLMAPLIHEFTYQAMAHDLLQIQDVEKPTFHMKINEGTAEEEEKDMELHDKDQVWVENRHRHMKDTIDKLMEDFNKFISQNPHFTNGKQDTTSLNAIKDMMAGLPQFQEMKEAYSLHLNMTQQAMDHFEHHKLPDLASVEQSLATGLDEDGKKPKNILVEVARLLGDEAITHPDRLRLIMAWIIYRDGVILEDIRRLLAHAGLPPSDLEAVTNLEQLGAHMVKESLKETRPPPQSLFPRDKRASITSEEYALSRYEPALKHLLDNLSSGTLDQTLFPYVKPPMDPQEDAVLAQTSLRAAAPRWAGAGRRVVENRQRYIVFMAGGATYSEARSCYEISNSRSKDVFLATSHMVTPKLFLRQVSDLSVDRRRLNLPQDRPKPRAPPHLFERPAPTPPPPQQRAPIGQGPRPPQAVDGIPGGVRPPQPPAQAMGHMNLGPNRSNGTAPTSTPASPSSGKLEKKDKEHKEHKKRRFLGLR